MKLQILGKLEDLIDEEFKKFKWMLHNQQPNNSTKNSLTKHALENATREETVDLLVEKYPDEYFDITAKVLQECGHNDMATSLLNSRAVETSQPCNITWYQEKLQSNLQDRFKFVKEGCNKKWDEQLLNDIYTELHVTAGLPLHTTEDEEGDIREQPVDTEEPIKPSQVFKAPDSRPVRTVLTSGKAGIGKTFLVHKFVLDWAMGQTNKDIHLVFPLTFRQLNPWRAEKMSLSELIHRCVTESKDIPKEALDSIFKTLQTSGNTNFDKSSIKVLFILDGLDESQLKLQRSTMPLDVNVATSVEQLVSRLINRDFLCSARLWITTRPAAASQIHPDLIDMVTEVRGFTDKQKEVYFQTRQKITDKKMLSHIKESRSLNAMCHIPVFCWITATVLRSLLKTKDKGDLPTSLTEMYIHFLIIRAKLNYEKSGGQSYSATEIHCLGKLAYGQLTNGNLIFNKADLEAHGITLKMAIDSGLITQLIREVSGLYQEEVYCFVHLSVQEFLAALHTHLKFFNTGVNLLSNSKRSTPANKHIPDPSRFYQIAVNKAIDRPNMDLFLRFLLGLSLHSNQELLQRVVPCNGSRTGHGKNVVGYLKKKIGEDSSPEGIINLFHCLNELNDHSLVEDIQKTLKTGNLSVKRMSPSDWSAVGYILLSSGKGPDLFDLASYCPSEEVLIRLMPLVKASNEALLGSCHLSEKSCAALVSVFSSASCSLTKLDLSNNCLKDSGVKLLCDGLRSPNCKLENLKLSGCLITAKGCSDLALALSGKGSLPRVKDLDVSYNNPGSDGTKQLRAWQNADRGRSCRLEPCGQQWLVAGLKKYWVKLSIDMNTINRFLALSEDTTKLSWKLQGRYEEQAKCFSHWSQVLCGTGLTNRCYWEVEWGGAVYISVAYVGMSRRAHSASSWFGRNPESWSLRCTDGENYYAYHDKTKTRIASPDSSSNCVGVYLDYLEGTLSFYCVSRDKEIHLHTFRTSFSQPLCAGFGLCWPLCSHVRLRLH